MPPWGLIWASIWLLLCLVQPVAGQEAPELSRHLSRPENCKLGQPGLQQVSLTAPAGIRQSQIKVALLFLTKGDLPFEPLWNTFLAGLSDVLTGKANAYCERFATYEVAGLLKSCALVRRRLPWPCLAESAWFVRAPPSRPCLPPGESVCRPCNTRE